MFVTFDLDKQMKNVESISTMKTLSKPTKSDEFPFFQKIDKSENERLGIRSRSRNGCQECKRKKKRCDEQKPKCSRCCKSNLSCIWPTTNKSKGKKDNKQDIENRLVYYGNEVNNDIRNHIEREEWKNNWDIILIDNNIKISPNDNDDNYNDDNDNETFLIETLKNIQSPDNNSFKYEPFFPDNIEININTYPSARLLQNLDDIEIIHLDYYRTCVSQTVSILPNETNFFLSLYLPLAENNKSILYALIGWSSVFLNPTNDPNVYLRYLRKSVQILEDNNNQNRNYDENKIVTISLYTIICAALICAGDVNEWQIYFKKLFNILKNQSNGKLSELMKYIGNNCKEFKWLISNFLYHDVLSSSSNYKGTFFKISEYSEILNLKTDNELIDEEIVCDPLQGCVRPLYVLIGEITNKYVELREEEDGVIMIEGNNNCNNFKNRIQLYNKYERYYNELKTKLKNTKPHRQSLKYLKNDKDLEIHLTLFETYKISLLIQLNTLIKKLTPESPEIQILLIELIELINIIKSSNVKTSLCFPLLIAGISCINGNDKEIIENLVMEMSNNFPVKTFQRIMVIIKKCWDINDNGKKRVLWFEISRDLGWNISFA
ncbi:hypothetical protein DAPK24_031070 [Pichia kluyveri]|uniref:Zn(2)-C6 fungal-type domain-containing protein n=1 Tax=Pichia kluyveri TaxID=36015 RepID=A0AAV5R5E3_PICKL|nr:hypothetical protein DAPK24_031070 [Pichia kluyveri]